MAPPIYKPLPVTQAAMPPLVADVFMRQFPDFNKDLAEQRILEAQGMTNDINRIKVADAQRQEESDRLLREELIAKYGGESPQEFNSDEALTTAQKLAIGQGDLDTALNVEKIQDSRLNYRPLSADQKRLFEQELGYSVPDGMTTSDLNALINLRGKNTYAQSLEDNRDKRQDQIASYAPGGYEAIIDPNTGQAPQREDSKKFTTAAAAHTKINSYLDQLEDSLSIAGSNDPTSPEFVRQRQLISAIQVAFKEKNNFGAALTANEQAINDAQLPRILAKADVGVGTALVEAGLGRDPREAIRNLKGILARELDTQAQVYKFRRKGEQQASQPLAQPYGGDMIPKVSGNDPLIGTTQTIQGMGQGKVLRRVR